MVSIIFTEAPALGILNKLQLIPYAAAARRERGVFGQAWDLLRCRYGPGKLGASEYYKYGLFQAKFAAAERTRFAGWRMEGHLDQRLNAPSWLGVTTDKLIQYGIFQGVGIPTPEIRAVYHPSGRYFGSARQLRTPGELADYLRNDSPYPFFSKPAHGSFGRGSFGVARYLGGTDELELLSGERMPLEDFVGLCQPRKGVYPWESGYLFQDCLVPHAATAAICGQRLSSLRLVVLAPDTGPRLFRAVWKIPTGTNMVDNFDRGMLGNLAAWVDTETGRVNRVIGGTGLDKREVTVHPDTGQSFGGLTIPQWSRVRELCLDAATVFPALRLQFWDIALTEDGPVVLEVNIGGNLDGPQQVADQGVLDEEFQAFRAQLARQYPA